MNENKKKTIGIFFGSGSPEHDVSIITAQLIIAGLKGLNYPVVPVYITKKGQWCLGEDLGNLKLFTDPNKKAEEQGQYSHYFLDMEESIGKIVFKKKGFLGKSVIIDLAFPALHGSFGEDGTIQGLFEMLGVPYVGCDVPASAIAMDKALTKIVMQNAGVPTTKFLYFTKSEWVKDIEKWKLKIENFLQYPLFVKPVHLGSSIGIGKAKDEKELEQKIEVALFYDNKVLVEEAVPNVMDVTCCVIGNEELTASLLQESLYSADLFDFEEKYLKDGGAQTGKAQNSLIIPARLDEQVTSIIQETAKQVYKALGCSGIARVDFLLDKQTKQFYANEVNPLPGTLYHHLWKASGIELPGLLEKLINFAEEKYKQKREINFTFESSLLKSLNSAKLNFKKLKNPF
ncbi:MAG: D-alanine--D-alanine ligase [Candidatus Doudnabacteria bacterium]|nr:D-alanine--D-alanine ligase [Candidatus Doudnabacteria bacterium]